MFTKHLIICSICLKIRLAETAKATQISMKRGLISLSLISISSLMILERSYQLLVNTYQFHETEQFWKNQQYQFFWKNWYCWFLSVITYHSSNYPLKLERSDLSQRTTLPIFYQFCETGDFWLYQWLVITSLSSFIFYHRLSIWSESKILDFFLFLLYLITDNRSLYQNVTFTEFQKFSNIHNDNKNSLFLFKLS